LKLQERSSLLSGDPLFETSVVDLTGLLITNPAGPPFDTITVTATISYRDFSVRRDCSITTSVGEEAQTNPRGDLSFVIVVLLLLMVIENSSMVTR
jgi:hypothetical protein